MDEFGQLRLTTPASRAEMNTLIASAFLALGQTAQAKQALAEALAAEPEHASALLARTRIKAAEEGPPAALPEAEALTRKFPQDAETWLFFAELNKAIGKTEPALVAYRKALEIKPKILAAHGAVIELYARANRLDEASKQLEAMQKVAAQHPFTLYMQSALAYARKDYATAKTAIDKVLKTQSDNPLALQLAGAIAFAQNSDLQAQDFLAKALQQAPGLDFARRILAASYLRSRQPTKALATLRPILKGDETHPSWLGLAGEVLLANGDVQAAAEYFARAARADPQDTRAKTALAMAKVRMGKSEQAFADLDQIAQTTADTNADMALIALSLQQKKFEQAMAAIDRLEKKQEGSPVPHNLRGTVLLAKGDKAKARASFEQALSLDPTFFPAAAHLARLDLIDKQPEQARRRFQAILAKDPQHVQALLALAEMNLAEKKAEEAETLIKKAIAALPDDPRARLALIDMHIKNKDAQKAQIAAQEALAALPDRPEILDAAGYAFQLAGDMGQALSIYAKLAALLPTAPHPYLRMAEIQLAQKDHAAARASLNKGIGLLPDSLALQRALVLLDLSEQKIDEALAKARAVQKSRPKESVGWLLEGDIHAGRQDWSSAANAYRSALKLSPANEIAEKLYIALLQANKAGEAKNFADGWLRERPKDAAFRMFLAEVANKRKDYATAASHYRALLNDNPGNAALLNNLAWSLGQLKDPKALEYAEEAYRRVPDHPAILDTLGWLLVETDKDPPRGVALLAKAVAAAPDAHVIRFNYARALLKTGKKAEAKNELERLSRLDERQPLRRMAQDLLRNL
ncbi:MAG: PEP-CTERM system TPR-repeat protein PrsT [Rhodocyclaceae bacterium]|nr:PEP-CTERM system TPR-repeat protein PrsT [Rhodocyclaceae bacterium]